MQRRTTVALLLSAALPPILLRPPESWAQIKSARVGIMSIDAKQPWFEPFQRTLAESRWVVGKNLELEYRSVGGNPIQFAEGGPELVRLKVDAFCAVSAPALHAAGAATRTIPIVAVD